jgi:multidrug efflux system membrane fusion protein
VHTADSTGLLVITQVQPIAVVFTIAEDSLPPVLKKLGAGARLPVEAYDRSGRTKIASGELLTVDNQIDAATGTSRLKAIFPNDDNALFPNQFVNVRMQLDVRKAATLVPSTAIQRGPQGPFAYVVKADQTVEVRALSTGVTEGDQTEITSGLSPDELVVVDGVDKLRAGSKVQPQNREAPAQTDRKPAA